MDSTTSTITDAAKRYIDEALKQSPNNPQSNGYGFVVATLAGFCILLLAVIWFLYRDGKRERKTADTERKQARNAAAIQIDGRFDKIEALVNDGLNEIEGKVDTGVGDLQSKYAAFREEFTRLKTIVEVQKGG
jgi:cbb3-type cytochrome oxidase subunit 3